MIHFAGGNIYSYKFLDPYLKEFKIETIELPGRGMRFNEKLISKFDQAALDIYSQVKSKLESKEFLIYGHSMGALLALKAANMLEKNGCPPLCLIVSGNPGPKIQEEKKRYSLNDKEFIVEVEKLGGLSAEVMASQELLDFFVPILKADFEISEENNLNNESIVGIPVYSVMGDSEKHNEHIANWSNYTTSDFNFEKLPGNHFFILNHAETIGNIITKCYKENLLRMEGSPVISKTDTIS